MTTIMAWHFRGADAAGRPVLRDGRLVPPVGEWLEHDGPVAVCTSGLHASRCILDALRYAPGCWLHRVECEGIVAEAADKLVCRRRRVVASADMTWALVTWAEWCAARAAAREAAWEAAWAARAARAASYAGVAAALAARDACDAACYAREAARYAREAARYAARTERRWQAETLEKLFAALAK